MVLGKSHSKRYCPVPGTVIAITGKAINLLRAFINYIKLFFEVSKLAS